jgi:hypothetical protein
MMSTRHLQKFFMKLCLLFALSSLAACSQTMYGVVKIESIPPGAEVINLKDDTHLGMTPLLVTWESDDDEARYATMELRKVGYVEALTSFWVRIRHETKEDAIREPQPVIVELRKKE